jgi:histidyl-tRNA synthetase
MMPDAEVLAVAVDILSSVPIGDFAIKLNHRRLLDAALDIAGVPASKFKPICSAIDKLDKESWADVRAEMIGEKGLSEASADAIGAMVQLRGEPRALLAQLTAPGSAFAAHPGAAAALREMGILFGYLESYGVLGKISFDLSLARGLDYYTGVIYEAVLLDPSIGVGSIAAGGRYDNLVGMFSPAGTVVPCVGVSIGVERVLAIMENKLSAQAQAAAAAAAAAAAPAPGAAATGGLQRTPVSVYVASIPSGRYDMSRERMAVCAALWRAGISAEMSYAADPKLQKQVTAAAEGGVPYMVVLGEDECDKGLVQVKDMVRRTAASVPRGELVDTLLGMGARVINHTGFAAPAAPVAAAGAAAVAVPPPAAEAAPVAAAPAAAPAAAGAGAAAPAVIPASVAAASGATGGTAAGKGSVGVMLEGQARLYGRFARPAVPIVIS